MPAATVTATGSSAGRTRSPRDAQRRRVYLAETPLPASPLAGLDACAAFMDRVIGTLWWWSRFPDMGYDRAPRLRPGHGARQAFFIAESDGGPSITLPRRYRTKGVVLHELGHFALSEQRDLPPHGRTFARLLLDMTTEFLGPQRAAALQEAYIEQRVHVGKPPLLGPDGRLRYGWDERLRLSKEQTLVVCHQGRGGAPTATTGVFEGWDRGARTIRVRVGRAADPWRIPVKAVWDVRRAS
jgi:putative metallohydrolase (TIGR04338 family)